MIVLSANIRVFNSFADSLTLHNSHFIGHTCICILYFVLIRTVEMLNKMIPTAFTVFRFSHANFLRALSDFILLSKERLEEKGTIFPFLLYHRFQNKWLARKEYEWKVIHRASWSLVFGRTPSPFCIRSKFWFKRHDLGTVRAPTY